MTPPTVVSVASVAELRMILTDRRIELHVALIDIDSTAGSTNALADRLDRDYRAVHDDVTLPEKHGMADRNDSHPPRGQQGGNQANGKQPPIERLGLSALFRLFYDDDNPKRSRHALSRSPLNEG